MIVRPPNLPQPLISEYLQHCRSDLVQLKAALTAGEYETARRLGHQMKGAGKPYGYPELTQDWQIDRMGRDEASGYRTRQPDSAAGSLSE